MTESAEADAILLLLEGPDRLVALQGLAGKAKIVVAANTAEELAGAKEAGLDTVRLDMPDSPVYERLTQSVLEAVADDILTPGSSVVALYSGFDADTVDSLSVINLDEHLNRLTGRDSAATGNPRPAGHAQDRRRSGRRDRPRRPRGQAGGHAVRGGRFPKSAR